MSSQLKSTHHFQIDSELQRLAAISNHLISSLFDLLKSKSSPPRVGAFRCFASLGANDENIRKRIIEAKGLMEEVLIGLGDPCADVRSYDLASCRGSSLI